MTYIYRGAMHIHTTYSDGTASIKEIAKCAKKAGLAWIVITDHNTLKGLENKEEGWYDGVAVIIGEEISPENSDHYLALGANEHISCEMPPQDYINKVKEAGGFGFIAHPDEGEGRKISNPPLKWTDWNVTGFDGLEIWNQLSDWGDNYDPANSLYSFFWRNHILKGPTKKTLKWWDDLNLEKESIVPAVCGVDAHALIRNYMGIKVKVFPYTSTFKTLTNNVFLENKLSESFEEAKKQIFNALKNGNNIIENRAWNQGNQNDSTYPLFYITDENKKIFAGGSAELTPYSKLIVKLPKKALVRIIYDGQLIWEYEEKELCFEHLDRGKYRVEAFYKGHPWVFANPVRVL